MLEIIVLDVFNFLLEQDTYASVGNNEFKRENCPYYTS